MMVITGPLFSSNDPVYKNDRMNYSVRCPLQFWKVCVLIRQDDTPAATGFVLGQEDIKDLPGFEEVFDVAATQIKIADLEKRTGLDFGRLRDFDHFAQGGAPGTLEMPTAAGASRPIKAIRSAARHCDLAAGAGAAVTADLRRKPWSATPMVGERPLETS